MSENFIVYDHADPAAVFKPKDLTFLRTLKPGFDDEDHKKLREFETARYNRTTGVVAFDIVPGLRDVEGQSTIYFSIDPKKAFSTNTNRSLSGPERAAIMPACPKFPFSESMLALATRRLLVFPRRLSLLWSLGSRPIRR